MAAGREELWRVDGSKMTVDASVVVSEMEAAMGDEVRFKRRVRSARRNGRSDPA